MSNLDEIILKLLNLLKQKEYLKVQKKALGALKHYNNNLNIINILGLSYVNQKKFSKAELIFKKGLEINRAEPSLNNSLGNLYSRLNQHKQAILYYNLALESSDPPVEIYNNLGNAYRKTGLFLESLRTYQKALRLKKNSPDLLLNCAILLLNLNKVSLANIFLKKTLLFVKNKTNLYSSYIANLLYTNPLDLKLIQKELKNFNSLFSYNENNNKINSYKNSKIRLGFVSADLRVHPIGFFLFDVLSAMKIDFEIYAYYNSLVSDDETNKFSKLFDKWSVIFNQNDEEVFKLIKNDKIDILFDLSGHSVKNRLGVFAKKPAKIQVSWAGYLMSTGLKQMDYIIVDPYVVKQTDQKYYSEKFILLNDIWCCYSNTSFLNIKVKKDLPLAANKFITFGSFNNLLKLNFEVIKVWSQILTNIPNSKLFLKNEMLGHEFIKERISKKFLDNGVKKDQLILEGLSPRSIFLQCYNRIDIALDTFPYNGGSTSFESSKMLVPLLTKQGNFFVSRCGLSINKNLMMDDWIADTNNSYIEKAISFSNNIDYLYSINKKLESTVDTSPLFNTEMFYKNLKKKIFELIKN